MRLLALAVDRDAVTEREARVLDPVAHRLEVGVVVEPLPLDGWIALEELGLFADRFLLAVAAVERIEGGEELLAVRLGDVPRRIAEHGVEAVQAGVEDVGELQLPVEESLLDGDAADDLARPRHRCSPAANCVGSGAWSSWSAARTRAHTTGRRRLSASETLRWPATRRNARAR